MSKYTSEQIVPIDEISCFGESYIDTIHKIINTRFADTIIQNSEQDIVIHFSDFYDGQKDDLFVSIRKDMTIKPLIRCKDCEHARRNDYAPAECQWYCTLSTNYHGKDFYCAMGERREDNE